MKPVALNGQRGEEGLAGESAKPTRARPLTFQGLFNGAVCAAFVLLTVACAGLFCRVGQMDRELRELRRACTVQTDGAAPIATPTASPPDGSAHLQQHNNNRQVHIVRKRGAAGPTEAPKRRHKKDREGRRGKKKDRCPKNCKEDSINMDMSTFSMHSPATLNNWILADWANKEDFHVASSGEITVEKSGVYFIYSQIVFYEKHHLVSHTVYVDGSMYLTCNESVENVTDGVTGRYKTCYVAGLAPLQAGARIEVRGAENMYALLFHDTTYLGLIKVADLPQN
ncbi:PREDICTED: uncharacterized protein LOC109485758 [Branchiostoma belcheri]|uniref:Uncharacterized protein LOC109485758 n=1 Tax=Branchiostoma belcheri TaxID=7741 RepID=A0A6P5A668_BRABE|nr:PREDICTED: uncharacterized protein LOC109485758 [Branchiostoma belcheri]